LKYLTSKCGFDCGTCPWGPYPRENMNAEEFEQYKKRAKKILGLTPMKTPCLLCQTPDEKIPKGTKLPLRNCLVRRCVNKIGVENCAYCSRFPCDFLNDHYIWNREYFEKKHGKPVTDEDYLIFIEPFEGLKRLKEIRATLKPKDIVEAPTVPPLKTKITGFPEDLPFSEAEKLAFRTLYEVSASTKCSSLGLSGTDTFPQQQRLKNRIPHVLRFLWILGRYAEFKPDDGAYLIVDAKTYIDNRGSEKALATWTYVKDVIFKVLPEFGIHSELVPSIKRWKTEMEGLRQKGWTIRLSFAKSAGGIDTLRALQTYTKKLDEKYGKKAFKYFKDIDMRVLTRE
jgi:hypothetical protein